MAHTPRIGIDCRFWGIAHAGLGRYTRELVLALLKLPETQAYHFTLFFQKKVPTEDSQTQKLLNRAHLKTVNIPHYSLKEQLLLGASVDAQNLDLMHYTHFNVPALTTTPFIVTIHDLIKHFFKGKPVTTHNAPIYWLKYAGYRYTINQAIHKSRHILVPTLFTKDQIISQYPDILDQKITITSEGVSAPYNQVPPKPSTKILAKYHLQKPFFIYTGSAYPSKNIPTLLEALKLYNQDHTDKPAQLLIACARNHFWEHLKSQVHHQKLTTIVKLPGRVPDTDLRQLYAQATAFIMPSHMEGFGLPALEAMSSGCPVIASNIASLSEVYSKHATYFHPQEPQALVDAMQQHIALKSADRQQHIQKALNHAASFTWQKAAHATNKVYSQFATIAGNT